MDCSLPSSSVHGIFHARTMKNGFPFLLPRSSQLRDWTRISCISCIAGRFSTTQPPGKSYIYKFLYKYIYIYIYVYSVMFSPLSSILLKTFPSDISGTLIFHKVHRSIISIVTYRSLWTSGQNWWLNHEINTLAVSKLHLEFYLPLKTKTSSPSQPLYAPGLDS